MSKFILVPVLLVFSFITTKAQANTLRILSGEIYAAQISTNKLSVGNADKPGNKHERSSDYSSYNTTERLQDISGNKGYVVLFVKLDEGRKLSLYDYTLKTSEGEFRCASIAKNNDIFKAFNPETAPKSEWMITDSNTIYRLLFVVKHPKASQASGLISMNLRYKLGSKPYNQQIKVESLGSKDFSKTSAVRKGKYNDGIDRTPKPEPVAEAPVAYTAPTTNEELIAYIKDTWKNVLGNKELVFNKSNRNKLWGWDVKDGKLYRVVTKDGKTAEITIISQDRFKHNNIEFKRIK